MWLSNSNLPHRPNPHRRQLIRANPGSNDRVFLRELVRFLFGSDFNDRHSESPLRIENGTKKQRAAFIRKHGPVVDVLQHDRPLGIGHIEVVGRTWGNESKEEMHW